MDWGSFNWQELAAVLVSAFVGWLARHFEVWLPPRKPDRQESP